MSSSLGSPPVPLSKAIGKALGGSSNPPQAAVLPPEIPAPQKFIPDPKTIKRWKKLAKRGDADAQNSLGIACYYGNGVQQDYNEMLKWLSKAAEQGHKDAQKNLSTIIEILHESAKYGDAVAQYNLGVFYYDGHGVPQNYAEAVQWFRKAAEQGHEDAQKNLSTIIDKLHESAKRGNVYSQILLGSAYGLGNGVRQDKAEAVKWFRKAAEQGDKNAQYGLGLAYEEGHGVSLDYSEAVKWYHMAAEQEDVYAQYRLGFAYVQGNGVHQNEAEAVKWFRKAAAQGHAGAQFSLGIAYANGHGVPQDDAKAVQWYHKAAEQGHAGAQYSLGVAYANGHGVPQDDAEAEKWYRKAAEQGDVGAQHNLGFIYYLQNNYAEALEWLAKAAEKENCGAQLLLSLFYHKGYATEQNQQIALAWLRKGAANWLAESDTQLSANEDQELLEFLHEQAEKDVAPAQVILYFVYRDGNGIAQNSQAAVDWLKKAAQQDDPLGQYALGLEYQEGRTVAADAAKAQAQFEKITRALEEKDKILSHFSLAGLSQIEEKPKTTETEDYPRAVKQWLVLLAQTQLNALLNALHAWETQEKLRQSKQELEDIQAMLAHKFRGTLRAIRYNLESGLPARASLDETDRMGSLLEIFSLVSADAQTLCERLRQDRQGDNRGTGSVGETLVKSLASALMQLLALERMDEIIQHYLAYAVRGGVLPAGVTRKDLRYQASYRKTWRDLQADWETQWRDLSQLYDLEVFLPWLEEHFFPLEVEGFAESPLQFSLYGVKESLLLIVMTELLVNAFRYYSSPAREAVYLRWAREGDVYTLSTTNPTSPQEKLKGSAKGHKFLNVIATKLGGDFKVNADENHYTASFIMPAELFN